MKPLTPPEKVRQAFDAAAKVIAAMVTEAAELSKKFGSESHLVKKKLEQLKILKSFYIHAGAYQDRLGLTIKLMTINYEAMQLIEATRSLGVPFAQAMELLDIPLPSVEMIKDIEALDRLIERLKVVS